MENKGTTSVTLWPVAADIFSICQLLMRLGVTANYVSFQQTAYAVYLAVQDPDRLALVSKWLYPTVSARYHTTWSAVERNIRTVAKVAWKNNPDLLCELAGHPLDRRPKAAQFLSILAFYFLRNQPPAV